jgi:hypothetical protein
MSDRSTFSGEHKGRIKEREIIKEVPIKEKETIVKEVPSYEQKSSLSSGLGSKEKSSISSTTSTISTTDPNEQSWGQWLRSYVPGTKEYAWSKDVSELQKFNDKFGQLPLDVVQSPDFPRLKQLFETANRRAVFEVKAMQEAARTMDESDRNSPIYLKSNEDFNAAQLRSREAMADVRRYFDELNTMVKRVEEKRSEQKKLEKDKPVESGLLAGQHHHMGSSGIVSGQQHMGTSSTLSGQPMGSSDISGQENRPFESSNISGQQQFGSSGTSSLSGQQHGSLGHRRTE